MINLLPPERQKKIRRDENLKIAAISGIVFAAGFLSFALMLALIKIDYSNRLRVIEASLAGSELQAKIFMVEDLEKQVEKNNILVEKVKKTYSDQIKIGDLFSAIKAAAPSGIAIAKLNFIDGRVDLKGFSPDRDLLADFKKNLENRPEFNDVNFPAGNWLAAENIEFNASFKYEKR